MKPSANGATRSVSTMLNRWRAVEQDGNGLDILGQRRRDKRAVQKVFRKLLKTRFPAKAFTQSRTYRGNKPVNSTASEAGAQRRRDASCGLPRMHSLRRRKFPPLDGARLNRQVETGWQRGACS